MKPIVITRTIAASPERVFRTVSDIRNFRRAVPHITQVEFLTDRQVGAGTRFRETRSTKGREHKVVLEVAEYVEDDRVRMISDAGGTIWDTVFTVSGDSDGATLEMRMDIRPHTLSARLTVPLIRGSVVKGVEADMDAVRAFCERERSHGGAAHR